MTTNPFDKTIVRNRAELDALYTRAAEADSNTNAYLDRKDAPDSYPALVDWIMTTTGDWELTRFYYSPIFFTLDDAKRLLEAANDLWCHFTRIDGELVHDGYEKRQDDGTVLFIPLFAPQAP